MPQMSPSKSPVRSPANGGTGPILTESLPATVLVSVKGDEVDTLYKGTGDERTIDAGLTPIVSGVVELAVKIQSKHGSISEASYRVDDGQPVDMTVRERPALGCGRCLLGYHLTVRRLSPDHSESDRQQWQFPEAGGGQGECYRDSLRVRFDLSPEDLSRVICRAHRNGLCGNDWAIVNLRDPRRHGASPHLGRQGLRLS